MGVIFTGDAAYRGVLAAASSGERPAVGYFLLCATSSLAEDVQEFLSAIPGLADAGGDAIAVGMVVDRALLPGELHVSDFAIDEAVKQAGEWVVWPWGSLLVRSDRLDAATDSRELQWRSYGREGQAVVSTSTRRIEGPAFAHFKGEACRNLAMALDLEVSRLPGVLVLEKKGDADAEFVFLELGHFDVATLVGVLRASIRRFQQNPDNRDHVRTLRKYEISSVEVAEKRVAVAAELGSVFGKEGVPRDARDLYRRFGAHRSLRDFVNECARMAEFVAELVPELGERLRDSRAIQEVWIGATASKYVAGLRSSKTSAEQQAELWEGLTAFAERTQGLKLAAPGDAMAWVATKDAEAAVGWLKALMESAATLERGGSRDLFRGIGVTIGDLVTIAVRPQMEQRLSLLTALQTSRADSIITLVKRELRRHNITQTIGAIKTGLWHTAVEILARQRL